MILFSGSVVCNDESKSRLMRMKGIFSMYLPHADREKITTSLKSGLEFKSPEFDKVTPLYMYQNAFSCFRGFVTILTV